MCKYTESIIHRKKNHFLYKSSHLLRDIPYPSHTKESREMTLHTVAVGGSKFLDKIDLNLRLGCRHPERSAVGGKTSTHLGKSLISTHTFEEYVVTGNYSPSTPHPTHTVNVQFALFSI